jgi:hypothetical protein
MCIKFILLSRFAFTSFFLREGLDISDYSGLAIRYDAQGAVRRVARVQAFLPQSQTSPRKTTRK